ncbi:helix-turn-helix transcriptional regulator [Ralstonia thomasii]
MMANQLGTYLLKVREVCRRRARGVSSHYSDIANGLFTRPVKLGSRTSAWPADEVETLVRAQVAGKTAEEIRALVVKLEAARAKAA